MKKVGSISIRLRQLLGSGWMPVIILLLLVALLAPLMLVINPLFVLVGFAGLLLAAAVFSKPYYGVLLYLLLLYVRPGDLLPALEPLRLTLLGVALLAAAFIMQLLVYREAKPIITPPMVFMGLLLAAIVLSMPGSFYKTITMTRFTDTLRLVFMTFLIVHLIDTVPRLRGFMGTLALIMAGLSTALVIRYFAMPWTRIDNGGSGGMIGGFLGDGNDYALAQNVILPWTFMLAATSRRFLTKGLFLYASLISVLAVACTFSRGGLLGLVALLLVMYLIWVVRSGRFAVGMFLAVVGVVVLVFSVLAFAPPDFLERITSIGEYEQDESAVGRLNAWNAGWQMFLDHPFFGVGAGAFTSAYGTKYMPPNAIAATWREAHNVYVQVVSEMGLVGLFAILGMVASCWWVVHRTRYVCLADVEDDRFFHATRAAVVGSAVAWLVSALFLSVAYYPHLYLLVVLSTCLERFTRYQPLALPEVEEVEEY